MVLEDHARMWDLEHVKYACIRTIVNTSLYIRHSSYLSPATQPDHIKTYPCRPTLFPCRIFTPKGHDGQSKLPLVVRAHGGGFIVNNPAADDEIARRLADHARCIVVSIDYSKSPQNKFPTAYEDAIAQTLAIISDQDIPIDQSRIILCGSSAGGNLVLAIAQDPRLRTKVLGIAAIYPVVDLVENGEAKMAKRPDATVPDFIGSDTYAGLSRLYLDAEQMLSLGDPRVSPAFFPERESLPGQVLIIGAEHDMFCHEDEVMANKLAEMSGGNKDETDCGWKAPGVQWYKVMGQPHAFDGFAAKPPIMETDRVAAVDAMYSAISEWLIKVCKGAVVG